MKRRKVLVVAPHMDDEVLGCAGAICKHKASHDKVWVVFVAHRVYNHIFDKGKNDIERKHALKAKSVLGYDEAVFFDLSDERLDSCAQEIIIPLEKMCASVKPQIVYLPFRGDNNQDHRAVFDAARVVFRPQASPFIEEINMFEVASSTEQSPPLADNAFLPNFYIDISRYLPEKLKALACYETEKRSYPHPRSKEAVRVLAQKRGIEIGYESAEAFMIIRRKLGR